MLGGIHPGHELPLGFTFLAGFGLHALGVRGGVKDLLALFLPVLRKHLLQDFLPVPFVVLVYGQVTSLSSRSRAWPWAWPSRFSWELASWRGRVRGRRAYLAMAQQRHCLASSRSHPPREEVNGFTVRAEPQSPNEASNQISEIHDQCSHFQLSLPRSVDWAFTVTFSREGELPPAETP